jgi:hypothetical protein
MAKQLTVESSDNRYLEILWRAMRVCARYQPMFGQGRKGGMTLAQFQALYQADPFYVWVGLDSPLMYAAHKAAGGMTSIYRQLGIGCQWIIQQMLQDSLGLSTEEAGWSYQIPKGRGREKRTLTLDGRIDLSHIREPAAKRRVAEWIELVKEQVALPRDTASQIRGVVFEVRQGYKSKDSKRQNADIANATNAYVHHYIPVLLLLSAQIDSDVASRYAESRWLLLTGALTGPPTESTYTFCRDVVGYDLAGFFQRNSGQIKRELETVLSKLLQAT